MYDCMYACMYVCLYAYLQICMYAWMYVCMTMQVCEHKWLDIRFIYAGILLLVRTLQKGPVNRSVRQLHFPREQEAICWSEDDDDVAVEELI